MDKKTKKSVYNRKFRELQKSKIQNETVAPKVQLKEQVKVEVKPSNPDIVQNAFNFNFQNIINKAISSIKTCITDRTRATIQYYTSGGNEFLTLCKIYVGLLIISEIKYIVN